MNLDDVTFSEIDTKDTLQYETPVDISSDPYEWRKWATCANKYGDDPTVFWCSRPGIPMPEARRICWEECPVRRECLVSAIAYHERFCVYGGYSYSERNAIRARWEEEGTLIDFEHSMPDPEAVFKLIAEASISGYGDTPGDEPSAEALFAIEDEDST